MSKEQERLVSREEPGALRRRLEAGRVGTYALLGAGTGVIPLPWVPSMMARRVRGAMVHDIAARHGLSLTPEARTMLEEPAGIDGPQGIMAQGVTYAVTRILGRIGPFAILPPLRNATMTFLLGHLFQRYLETIRSERAIRIDVDEARRVRRAVDQSLIYALTTQPFSDDEGHTPPEDLRDQPTQIVDGVLMGVAGLPGWVMRRIEVAFDDVAQNLRA